MSNLIVTIDIDWACEPAIEETLDFLKNINCKPTIFATHPSRVVENSMRELEVGLHPFFGANSSHGATISEVVNYVMDLPHNFPGFRCHQYAICNSSKKHMFDAGMLLSSNVCTDLEKVQPFNDRFGFLEVPIFLEDGGYLWREHPLIIDQRLTKKIVTGKNLVLLIHPMHFALNTPHFAYMYDIKQSVSRQEWRNMTQNSLKKLRWNGRGIRDFLVDLLKIAPQTLSLGDLLANR